MRYRLMAMYDGSPFEAGIGPTADDIVLFAACPPPEALAFEPATGHWRKQVRFSDVQAVWESRPVGVFRGERCLVLDDLGDRLHIAYPGHDGIAAEQLGYWQVDRGVFELIAPRSEVTGIAEERIDVARPPSGATSGQQSEPVTSPGFTTVAPPARPPADPGFTTVTLPARPPADPGFTTVTPPARPPTDPAYVPIPDARTGVTLPLPLASPMPLEAEAMLAASEAGLRAVPAPEPDPDSDTYSRQGRAARRRMDTEELFAELADLVGIPADSYAVGEEVEGALCLLQTESGFDVFFAAGGARHELQTFENEEAACFYLFGVLAAEAVRTGTLARVHEPAANWQSQTA